MGKVLGAVIRFMFLLGLLGLVAYNTVQTAQLRSEVAALRQQSVGNTVRAKSTVAPTVNRTSGDPASLLAAARRHYDAAQAHLGRKEYAEASREMALATEAAKKAGTDAGKLSGDKVREFQQAVQSLSSRADELLGEGEGSGPTKPKSGASK